MSDLFKIFVDESGNLDFSKNGTKYFVLSAVSTTGCLTLASRFHELKHSLVASHGLDLERFHATEDKQMVRDRVFDAIHEHARHECFDVDAVVVRKNKTNPAIRALELFYPRVLKVLLQYVFRHPSPGAEKVLVWTDRIEVTRKRRAVEKAVKSYLANELRTAIPYSLFHHASASEPWLQVADYCGWSVYRKWTDRELRPYERIRPRVRSEFDIFERGDTEYY